MSSVTLHLPTTINYVDPDTYAVDYGQDGVAEEVLTEQQVNQMLAAYGVQAAGGVFRAVDGFALAPQNAAPVLDWDGPPQLPDVVGPELPADRLAAQLQWAEQTRGVMDLPLGDLEWLALSAMAESGMSDLRDNKMLKNALQYLKAQLKQQKIKTNEMKIQAERKAAWSSFVGSVVGAVATICLAKIGAGGFGNVKVGTPAAAVASTTAYTIGNVVSSFERMISKNMGPQAEADRKQIESMRWEREEDMNDQVIESARSNYEEAKEALRLAIKIINEHQERQTQISQTLTR